jgi:AraC-like DNA-binding protein
MIGTVNIIREADRADPLVRDERLTAAVTAIAQRGAAHMPRTRALAGGAQRRIALRAPADAATAAGFADQAHFGRWFQRTYGITPGTFVRAEA